ncbi:hypothetical protein [Acetobacter lovaniensis]|uniref:Uncharacterized protein n=1 Tax=Acetobacter lovaniensis TaxID=104100 RepID=A0A841QFQ5_9PROT|nr:hypothetical protein [Acetobacter lovaniensis]MBB6457248.1 hypothetical protein [Acetobacter lovaniensis]NHN81697.1 hypothetical protein [Acetobacter lovaniensis]GBQ63778.1 hypothetical protein AA0474_0389 [Acetobacter lovaniensis NRIC 0474]
MGIALIDGLLASQAQPMFMIKAFDGRYGGGSESPLSALERKIADVLIHLNCMLNDVKTFVWFGQRETLRM